MPCQSSLSSFLTSSLLNSRHFEEIDGRVEPRTAYFYGKKIVDKICYALLVVSSIIEVVVYSVFQLMIVPFSCCLRNLRQLVYRLDVDAFENISRAFNCIFFESNSLDDNSVAPAIILDSEQSQEALLLSEQLRTTLESFSTLQKGNFQFLLTLWSSKKQSYHLSEENLSTVQAEIDNLLAECRATVSEINEKINDPEFILTAEIIRSWKTLRRDYTNRSYKLGNKIRDLQASSQEGIGRQPYIVRSREESRTLRRAKSTST